MNHVASKKPAGKKTSTPRRREDVEALIALVSLDQCMARLAEKADTVAASGELREQRADTATRRAAITNRIPRATLEDYENALRHGLVPAAVATRGQVCWGCFHRLSGGVTADFQNAQAFVCCPHCERVLFNPDWSERR